MFQKGDLIRRKKEHIDRHWEGMCIVNGFKTDVELVVSYHNPERQTVKFKTPNGMELGVYDYKMELVNFSLENE